MVTPLNRFPVGPGVRVDPFSCKMPRQELPPAVCKDPSVSSFWKHILDLLDVKLCLMSMGPGFLLPQPHQVRSTSSLYHSTGEPAPERPEFNSARLWGSRCAVHQCQALGDNPGIWKAISCSKGAGYKVLDKSAEHCAPLTLGHVGLINAQMTKCALESVPV